MKRADAARSLAEVLGVGVVGILLDEIGDRELRDLIMKVQIRAREIAVDAEAAAVLRGAAPSAVTR